MDEAITLFLSLNTYHRDIICKYPMSQTCIYQPRASTYEKHEILNKMVGSRIGQYIIAPARE